MRSCFGLVALALLAGCGEEAGARDDHPAGGPASGAGGAASAASAGSAGSGGTAGDGGTGGTPPVVYSLVTSTHRHDPGKMWSGWGNHLGHLVRAPDGSLFYVDDTGNDVNVNAGLAYYHFVGGKWTQVGTAAFYGLIQQNTGSVLAKNGIVYTYGVDVADGQIEECAFDTTALSAACNLTGVLAGDSANYIGAAVSPSGYRVVWWTTTNGTFRYAYELGGGWNGPVVSSIAGYGDFSYVTASFSDDTHIHISGEGVTGDAPNWSYDGLYSDVVLGMPITGWTTLPGTDMSGPVEDTSATWVDASGAVHMIGRTTSGEVYVHRSPAGELSASHFVPGVSGGRLIASADGNVYYVTGDVDGGIRLQSFPTSRIAGPIPWDDQPIRAIPGPPGLGRLILFPEIPQYQNAPVPGASVVANDYTNEPGSLWYAALTE